MRFHTERHKDAWWLFPLILYERNPDKSHRLCFAWIHRIVNLTF